MEQSRRILTSIHSSKLFAGLQWNIPVESYFISVFSKSKSLDWSSAMPACSVTPFWFCAPDPLPRLVGLRERFVFVINVPFLQDRATQALASRTTMPNLSSTRKKVIKYTVAYDFGWDKQFVARTQNSKKEIKSFYDRIWEVTPRHTLMRNSKSSNGLLKKCGMMKETQLKVKLYQKIKSHVLLSRENAFKNQLNKHGCFF